MSTATFSNDARACPDSRICHNKEQYSEDEAVLKKIKRIGYFRSLKNWSSPVEFATVNLIYGVNGSGKSTLTDFLQDVADPSGTANPEVRVEVSNARGQDRVVNGRDEDFWPNVRVFNAAFIEKNLKFDSPSGPDAPALLAIGERNIAAEARREAVATRLVAIQTESQAATRLKTSEENAKNELMRNTARSIAEELQGAAPRYEPRSYNATKVSGLLADEDAVRAAASTDVVADLAAVNRVGMEAISGSVPDLPDLSAKDNEIAALLLRTVTSVPIPALQGDRELANWVQDGLHLHSGKTTCQFCGADLTEERKTALERHFDASLIALQTDLRNSKTELEGLKSSASGLVARFPARVALYENLRERYASALGEIDEKVVGYVERIDQMLALLDSKQSSMFSSLDMEPLPATSVTIDTSAARDQIRVHNEMSESLAATKLAAATRVENERVLTIAEAVASHATAAAAASDTVRDLQSERNDLTTEAAGLRTDAFDPRPLARLLNRDLSLLLGRGELQFEVVENSYKLTRNGDPATHLSEGEKTAIALLYFLSALEQHDVDSANTVVVIDDPVSSMDSDVLVGASSHLWGRLANATHCEQVFVFTHNYELFRMWSALFERRRNPWKRDRPGKMFELRMKTVPDGTSHRRTPQLEPWAAFGTPLQAKIKSEYHYMFWRLGSSLVTAKTNPTPESEIDAAALLPNVARRLLEAFLGFKYPDKVGDFEGSVRKAIESGMTAETQDRITRFLHQQSHYENPDITSALPRPEAITILSSVFDLIKIIDEGHFDAMCTTVALDPALITNSDHENLSDEEIE